MAKNNFANQKPLTDASTAALEEITGNKTGDSGIDNKNVAAGNGKDALQASQIKDEAVPKAVFNTKKTAELVGDASVPASGLGLSAIRSAAIPFGGGAGFIGKDKSATVKGEGLLKSGDRPGRTMDTALRHLDDIPAETYVVPINTIPNIKDGANSVAYNGNYENEHAISQKGSGGTPASNKFFRTLDLCEYDMLYWAEGQYNKTEATGLSIGNWNTSTGTYDVSNKTFNLGNFLLRKLQVTLDKDNNVKKMNFIVDDMSRKTYDAGTSTYIDNYLVEDEARAAGDALLRNANIAELDRINMVKLAGDEAKTDFSPLGAVIKTPTDANRLMKQLDAMAGDYVAIAGTKLSHALAYQINKAAKDGMRKVSPCYEMVEADIEDTIVRHASYTSESIGSIFDASKMSKGSAALYIAINDSTPKYNTKAKFLSLPLSFKAALETAKKNCGNLMMHEVLWNEFNRQEVFGKVDEDGSGLTPYFISDGAGIVLPVNIAETFNNNQTITDNKIEPAFTIHYEDMRNRYNYAIYNFFVQGLVDWFVRKAANIRKQCNATAGQDFVLTIPVTSTTTGISLWDLIVSDASKDIAVERQYALEPVLKYEANHGYPYSGLTSLNNIKLGDVANIGFIDVNTPLNSRPIPLNVAVKVLLPEIFSPKSTETFSLNSKKYQACQIILPWYFNQAQFTPTALTNGKAWNLKAGDNSYMTFFDSRGGVTFGNMDRIMAMDPEQVKLCMDRMINIPAPNKQIDKTNYVAKTYKYSNGDDGLVIANYYGFIQTDPTGHEDEYCAPILQIRDVLSTPRELGLSCIAPAGIVTPAYDGVDSNYRDITSSYLAKSGPSFRIKYWHVATTISDTIFTDYLLDGQGLNFSAKYDTIEATPDRGSDAIGIYLYANKAVSGSPYVSEDIIPFKQVTGDGSYDFTTGTYSDGETTDTGGKCLKLNSMLKYLYTRIQILPYILNPFDACVYAFSTSDTNFKLINKLDDFDFLHLYNVCGFRAGEYSGVQYDRNRARINLGLGYVSDPYIERRL